VRLRYRFDGPRPLGTGGAIRQALPDLSDAFFVLYGDSYLECDYSAIQQAFAASGKAGLMTVYRNVRRRQDALIPDLVVARVSANPASNTAAEMGVGAPVATGAVSDPESAPCLHRPDATRPIGPRHARPLTSGGTRRRARG
jgi:hypothetical protein